VEIRIHASTKKVDAGRVYWNVFEVFSWPSPKLGFFAARTPGRDADEANTAPATPHGREQAFCWVKQVSGRMMFQIGASWLLDSRVFQDV